MKTASLSNAPKVPFNLEGFIMHSSGSLEVIHLCLQPWQNINPHTNPFDVVACLVEGEVTLQVEETECKLGLWDVVEIEKQMSLGFSNNGSIVARLLIIKKL
ncbi:MAG: cupin domain-containing protein [Bacteroidales bacterium]